MNQSRIYDGPLYIKLDRYFNHTIEVVVDRLVSKDGIQKRLSQSLETALNLTDGTADIDIILDFDEANLRRAMEVFAGLGFRPRAPAPPGAGSP